MNDKAQTSQSRQPRRSILEVVGARVELRKVGRQFKGLCPFHSEKTPSFTVNEDKGVFYCHGCLVGGDTIRFIELSDQTDFKGALKILEIDASDYKPKARDLLKQRRAAMVAAWMNEQHTRTGAILRELSREIAIAHQVNATTPLAQSNREFSILETFFEDLQQPEFASELFAVKDSIERITASAPVEPLPEFPAWTPEYSAYLAAHVPEVRCPCCQ